MNPIFRLFSLGLLSVLVTSCSASNTLQTSPTQEITFQESTPISGDVAPTNTVILVPQEAPTIESTPTNVIINDFWHQIGETSASEGGISKNKVFSDWPSVAINQEGFPIIAWFGGGRTGSEIFVIQWDGNSWVDVGTGSSVGDGISNTGAAQHPSLAVAPDGTVYVTWNDTSNGFSEIYVKHWNGSTWEEVGSGSASGRGISNNSGISDFPSIAVSPNGTPYIAWYDTSISSNIYVKYWDGELWVDLGGINNKIDAEYPSIAVSSDGIVYVVWSADGPNSEIYIQHWNGENWEQVGDGSATGGGISSNEGASTNPHLAIAPDDTIYVVWNDSSGGNMEIFIKKWTGSTWEEVGIGSASGGGISNTEGVSLWPDVAIGIDGFPYVTWRDDKGFSREIFVRRWKGNNWVEVEEGSASNGGISNSGECNLPSIAIAPNRVVYVAWQDASPDNSQIYLMSFEE